MSRTKKNYSADFKQKAVELSYARGSLKQISEELDIAYSVFGEAYNTVFSSFSSLFKQKNKTQQQFLINRLRF